MARFPYKFPGISVYKRSKAGPRSAWLAAYQIPGQPRIKALKLSADVQIAAKKAREIAALVAAGKEDPKLSRFALMEHRRLWAQRDPMVDQLAADKPATEESHLADYHQFLLAEGNTAKHCEGVIRKCRRILMDKKIDRISELLPGPIKIAIHELTDSRHGKRQKTRSDQRSRIAQPTASAQTKNHYLRAIKQFSAWLAGSEKRASEDLLKHLELLNMKTDRRHDRQDLGEEGLAKLISAARSGLDYLGLTGIDRAWLYETAAESGLRANELRTLTPRRCHLVGQHPYLHVIAGHNKSRREDQQPVTPQIAARLSQYLKGKLIDEPIWKVPAVPADLMRSRAWCSMQSCGNREKARVYRARHAHA